jgi:ferritin-like metal-binding protein YciE
VAELKARDAKLIQYLREAHVKERELEQALQAHISMTALTPYRKRLQQHLTETKNHARSLERRIKQLGGGEDGFSHVVAEATARAQEVAARGAALAQGPVHALRGTGEQEKMLKNAKTEIKEEAEEIANYTAIEQLAKIVGDRDTAALAKAIRREEERMRGFLERLIPRLTKAVAQAEIPASERNGGRRRSASRRKSTGARTKARTASRRSGSARGASSRGTTKKRATTTRASASRSRAATRSRGTSRRTTAGSGSTTRSRPTSRSSASSSRRSTGSRAKSGSRK